MYPRYSPLRSVRNGARTFVQAPCSAGEALRPALCLDIAWSGKRCASPRSTPEPYCTCTHGGSVRYCTCHASRRHAQVRCITSGGACVSYDESLCTDHWGCSPLGEARGLARCRPTEPTGALGGRRRGLGQGTLSREPTDTTPTPDPRDPSPNPSPSPSPNPSPRPNLIPDKGTLARERAYGRPPWPGPRPGRAAVHALDCRRDGRGP